MKNAGRKQPRNFDLSSQKKEGLCRASHMDPERRLQPIPRIDKLRLK
jgi:hypothetical protein